MKKQEYQIRSDLALHKKGLKLLNTTTVKNLTIKTYKSKQYSYTNIIFNNLETKQNCKYLSNILIKELKKYYHKYNCTKNSTILVVGLGNKNVTGDSLGPCVTSKVISTAQYYNWGLETNFPKVYTYIPDVLQNTGLSAYQGIKALTTEIKPDILIIIDSLICSNINYLNKLVQITDIGITPGSGLSSYQEEISFTTLGIPTIVIGVPTAIESSTIIKDALGLKTKKITFKKGYDLLVSPKDIDLFINNISKIIALSINHSLNIKSI